MSDTPDQQSQENDKEQLATLIKVAIIAGIGGLILIIFIVLQYTMSKKTNGTLVLPNGTTYMGPSTEENKETQVLPTNPPSKQTNVFTAPSDGKWKTVKGNVYPYTFSAPETLKLVTFPNDKYDIYAIDWGGITPQSNVLIGVDNLKNDAKKSEYISSPKKVYVSEWWKQFGGLKGVASIKEFTNSNGLKGYRAQYATTTGQVPNEDVFFEIDERPEVVIHLARGVLDQAVFDKMIDSLNWTESPKPEPTKTTSD